MNVNPLNVVLVLVVAVIVANQYSTTECFYNTKSHLLTLVLFVLAIAVAATNLQSTTDIYFFPSTKSQTSAQTSKPCSLRRSSCSCRRNWSCRLSCCRCRSSRGSWRPRTWASWSVRIPNERCWSWSCCVRRRTSSSRRRTGGRTPAGIGGSWRRRSPGWCRTTSRPGRKPSRGWSAFWKIKRKVKQCYKC